LQREFAASKLDALLVSCETDILYLTGFVGHDSLLLVTAGGAAVISAPRYDEFLNPWRNAGALEVVMGKRHRLAETVKSICTAKGIRRLGIQAEHVTIAGRESLAATIGNDRLIDTKGLVKSLRRRKDELEIATIERALTIQQAALDATIARFQPGMTERQFSAVLEYEMKSRGADGASFTPIIGAGANSSIIHHATGNTTIQHGVLLVDWGAMIDGYNGDLTRTFAVGGIDNLPKKIREIYPIVLEAQLAAIDAIAPGKVCAEIDAVARSIITKAGYGEFFGHGLGHGLGMDVHEPPFFNDLETTTALEPGMVMTVEPGIYLPGIGGVRIEDDVLVTNTGCRVLSNYPKDDFGIIAPGGAKSKVQMTKIQMQETSGQSV
jgi:Xaa-Pro aminopeptidase